jgi:hypothetical protein
MSAIPTPRKNLIIAGVPRSGKSILSRRLSRALGASHIPIDSLVSSFQEVHPEIGISHSLERHEEICERFRPFLAAYFRHLEYEAIPLIIDVWQLRPGDAVAIAPKSKYEILYLGYPSACVDEKCGQIRAAAGPEDWTEDMDEPALRSLIEGYIAWGNIIQEECERLSLRFVDTGLDFTGSLDRAFAELLGLVGG